LGIRIDICDVTRPFLYLSTLDSLGDGVWTAGAGYWYAFWEHRGNWGYINITAHIIGYYISLPASCTYKTKPSAIGLDVELHCIRLFKVVN
jgi:hypothetical protein